MTSDMWRSNMQLGLMGELLCVISSLKDVLHLKVRMNSGNCLFPSDTTQVIGEQRSSIIIYLFIRQEYGRTL